MGAEAEMREDEEDEDLKLSRKRDSHADRPMFDGLTANLVFRMIFVGALTAGAIAYVVIEADL